jgi:hypothetical protein
VKGFTKYALALSLGQALALAADANAPRINLNAEGVAAPSLHRMSAAWNIREWQVMAGCR